MVRRRERNVRPDHRVIADEDLAVVDGRQVVVGVDLFAEVQVMPAPVGVQRRLDVAVLPNFCQHLLEHLLPLLPFMRPRGIVVVELFHAVELLLHQFLITRPVDLTVHHVIVHLAQWKSPLFCVDYSLSFPKYSGSTARSFFPAK